MEEKGGREGHFSVPLSSPLSMSLSFWFLCQKKKRENFNLASIISGKNGVGGGGNRQGNKNKLHHLLLYLSSL